MFRVHLIIPHIPQVLYKLESKFLNAKEALSTVMSQLKEKSRERFLSENDPGDDNLTPNPPCDGASDKSDDSQCLGEAVSHSLTGSHGTNHRDSITKRRSQMGLLDTDGTSNDSLSKLWDNNGNITSWSYVEHAGDKQGVTFLTPNNEKLLLTNLLLYINVLMLYKKS